MRAGTRLPIATPLPAACYFGFLSRAQKHKGAEVWPIAMDAPLPSVSVPLLAPDADVQLDLQAALTTIYDILGYDEMIDYSLPPPGPLSASQVEWVRDCLIKSGRRVS